MNIPDSNWWRSSFCGPGECLEAFRAGRLVLVRDSKQAPAVAVIQQWTAEEWEDLLNAIKRHDVHHTAIDWLSGYGAGDVLFGLHRHEKLTFNDEEWDAFVDGVRLFEFEYATLPSYASTLSAPAPTGGQVAGEVGPDVSGSDQVVTGAGAIAVPPVPVAATEGSHYVDDSTRKRMVLPRAAGLDLDAVRTRAAHVIAGPWTVGEPRCIDGVDAWEIPIHLPSLADGTPDEQSEFAVVRYQAAGFQYPHSEARVDAEFIARAREDIPALIAEVERLRERSVPVAAQPRYILDAPAILDMVGRYAEACVEAATTGSPKGREDAREQIRDLWDAIRGALTAVPAVEPEPRWGAGPLVEHVHETPAVSRLRVATDVQTSAASVVSGEGEADPVQVTPGTGSADPDGARYPRFSPQADLLVDAHSGPEQWTGQRWNDYVAAAERSQSMVTARLLEVDEGAQGTPGTGSADLEDSYCDCVICRSQRGDVR